VNSFLAILFAYLLGSLSFGYLLGKKLRGVDVRRLGSGSSGATNILRTLGTGPAIVVLLLDVGKGIAAVYLAKLLDGSPMIIMLAGIAVVAGHNWPIMFGFRGGRGVATSMGVLLGLAPGVILVAFLSGSLVIALTRYVSLGSIVGSILIPVLMVLFRFPPEYILFGTALCAFAVWRHKANIRRLLNGTESKLGERVSTGKEGVQK
jgi:glycerol-3-phosphate acyltransferase PlsY